MRVLKGPFTRDNAASAPESHRPKEISTVPGAGRLDPHGSVTLDWAAFVTHDGPGTPRGRCCRPKRP